MHYLLTPSSLRKPYRLAPPLSWAGHIPFMFWLIEQAKPAVVVELGTHSGNSYFAACQAIQANHLPAVCYAVDTWQGDEHAGIYDSSVYDDVAAYNESRYKAFSSLLRMTFNEALGYFSDGSIDLLHIDGLHTYEAVRHDFESWLPKLSEQGVALFHDTNVRERGFGVWKLWDELLGHYPAVTFDHSHGLGVLFTGNALKPVFAELLDDWKSMEKRALVKNFFSMAGERIVHDYQIHELSLAMQERHAHIRELADIVSIRESEIRTLQQTNANLQQTNDEQHNLVCTLEKKAEQTEARYRQVIESMSWKLTKPFRKLARSLGKRLRITGRRPAKK